MIGTQASLTLCVGVAIGWRIVTAGAPAVRAYIALFEILSQAIAGELVAAAVITVKFDQA